MLEAIDLSRALDKATYKDRLPALQARLHELQRACFECDLATIVVFEGWDAAGKGSTIRKLAGRLEPRALTLHATRPPRTASTLLPWLWRFWQQLPAWGQMAIFDRSWYGRVLVEGVEQLVDADACAAAYEDIAGFERTLADDRYQIVKLFLHIDRQEQRRRFEALQADPLTAWQVEEEDWHRHERYDDYLRAVEEMLARTDTEWGPWTLVAATDRRWTRLRVFEVLVERMESGLLERGCDLPTPVPIDDRDNGD